MRKNLSILTALILVLPLVGCSTIGNNLGSVQAGYDDSRSNAKAERLMKASERIMSQAKKLCEADYIDRPETLDNCIEYIYTTTMNSLYSQRSGSSSSPTNIISSPPDNSHIQRQILNHGAGGCTPNFSTGGCL